MAKKSNIGVSVGVSGEKEFRKSISEINSDMKVLGSEMRKVTERFASNDDKVVRLTEKDRILNEQIEKQRDKVDVLKKALEDTEKNYEGNVTKINKWQTSLNTAEAELYKLENELGKNSNELKEARNETNKNSKAMIKFKEDIKNTENNLKEFGTTVAGEVTAKAITKGLDLIATGLKKISDESINAGMGFEAAMSQVAATMGMTKEEVQSGTADFEMLKKAARDMGAATKYSASEAAEAENYLALAGYDAKKSVETLPTVLNLAAAGGMELATASDMVTDAMSALGKKAGTAESYVDKMAKTAQKSNTSVAQLGEATLTVGGTAKKLKNGVTEMNTVLGIFADNGIKGAEGGTHLRNIILALNPTTDKAVSAFQQLGLSAYDANGKMRPINETFKELKSKISDMTDKEQQSILSDIFNKTDLKAVEAMLANCGGRFDELSGYIKNADGAAQDMADTMNDNLQGKLKTMESVFESVGISAYEKMEQPLKEATEIATTELSKLGDEIANGELGDSLEDLGEVIRDNSDELVEFVEGGVEFAIDAFSFLVEHVDEVTTGLKIFGAALVAIKIVQFGNTAVTAFRSVKTAVDAAKASQLALNAAQYASPVGIILALSAAAVGAGVAIYNMANEESEEAKAAREEREETDRLVQSLKDKEQAIEENIKKGMAEIDKSEDLWKELQKIVDKNGEIKAGYESRAKFITGELQEATGIEIEIVDGVIQKYDDLKGKIEDVIATKRAQFILDAHEEEYRTAIQNETQAYADADAALKKYQSRSKEINAEIEKLKAQESPWASVLNAYNEKKIEKLEQEKKDLEKSYKGKAEAAKKYTETIAEYETNAVRIISGNAEEIKKVYEEEERTITKNNEKVKTTTEELITIRREQLKTLQEEIAKGNKNITEEQVKNLESEISILEKMLEEEKKEVYELSKQVGSNVYLGVKASKFNTKLEEYGENAGVSFTNALIRSLNGDKEGLKDAIRESSNTVRSTLGINSPSKVFRELGHSTGEGFELGTNESMANARRSLEVQINKMAAVQSPSLQTMPVHTSQKTYGNGINGNVSQSVDMSGDLTLNLVMPNGEQIFSTVYQEFRKKKKSDSTLSMA